jgi:hypothetical protein
MPATVTMVSTSPRPIGAIVLRRIERDLDLEAMLLRDSAGSDWERADPSRAAARETTRLG